MGTELRNGSRRVLQRIIEANEARDASDREPALEILRRKIEILKATARLAQESGSQAPAVRLPVVDGQRVRRSASGTVVEQRLWQAGTPVAWIGETGQLGSASGISVVRSHTPS